MKIHKILKYVLGVAMFAVPALLCYLFPAHAAEGVIFGGLTIMGSSRTTGRLAGSGPNPAALASIKPAAANLGMIADHQINFTTPVTQQQNGNVIPVGPDTKYNSGGVQQVGSVFNTGSMVGTTALPTSIDFTLDNSLGAAPVTYLLFDEFGFYASNNGGAYSAPTTASSSVAAISKMSASSQIIFKGYNYQVTNQTQFSQPLYLTFGDADGTEFAKPIQNSQAKRNTQFVATLLTFETVIYVDGFRGMKVTVPVGEITNLSFFLAAGYGRQ